MAQTPMEYVIAKIKLEGALKEIFFKTTGSLVTMADGKTLEAAFAEMLTQINSLPTDSGIDNKIKTANDDLYNKIMGITADDGTTVDEAYDTLKEVAKYITEHGTAADEMINNISALQTAVTALEAIEATKVEKSDINGNIKINGQEVTVFTPSETISADKVTETDAKQFISKTEKEGLLARKQIFTSTAQPENMNDGDVWLQPVSVPAE